MNTYRGIIYTGIIIAIFLLGGRLFSQQYVFADSISEGFAAGCDDGQSDGSSGSPFQYHYDPSSVDSEYKAWYENGYYFGYEGLYSQYCNGNPICTFTHMQCDSARTN